MKCNNITPSTYITLKHEDESIPWLCVLCTIKDQYDIFPFGLESDDQLLNLYNVSIPVITDNLPSFEIDSRLQNIPNLKDFDMEENVVHDIHSDYYQLHEINNIISTKHISKKFALYHVNTDSLGKHFDDLRTILANSNITWDIIGISEISEQLGGFNCNIDLDGYHFTKQNSKTKKGGVGLYINNKLDHFERE